MALIIPWFWVMFFLANAEVVSKCEGLWVLTSPDPMILLYRWFDCIISCLNAWTCFMLVYLFAAFYLTLMQYVFFFRVFEGKVLNELWSFIDSWAQVRAASTDIWWSHESSFSVSWILYQVHGYLTRMPSFPDALKIISFYDNWVALNSSKILSFMTQLKNMFNFGFL